MNTLSYRTVSVNKEAADKKWVLVDAEGQALGRLASKVANIARGKYKTCYTPNMDCGDNVVIINAGKIVLTGKKMDGKVYTRYTGYPGGQRTLTAREVMSKDATRLVRFALKGMLPKNRLGAALMKNIFIYEGPEHQQQAQKPVLINLNDIR